MAAQTIAAPARRQRGFNLEKWGWLFMRASGIVLVVLIFGHLFINLMVGEGIHALDFAFIAGKFAIGEIEPFGLSTMRWVVAFVIIVPFAWASVREEWTEIRRGIWWLAFYGAIGFTTFNTLLYLSVTHTSAVSVAMIQSAIPILVMIGNFLIFRVRASSLHIIGVVLTIYGVIHVARHGAPLR